MQALYGTPQARTLPIWTRNVSCHPPPSFRLRCPSWGAWVASLLSSLVEWSSVATPRTRTGAVEHSETCKNHGYTMCRPSRACYGSREQADEEIRCHNANRTMHTRCCRCMIANRAMKLIHVLSHTYMVRTVHCAPRCGARLLAQSSVLARLRAYPSQPKRRVSRLLELPETVDVK